MTWLLIHLVLLYRVTLGPIARRAVPVSSDVQPVRDRRGEAAWAVAGELAGDQAHLPLPSWAWGGGG
jgi:hypothetical protein